MLINVMLIKKTHVFNCILKHLEHVFPTSRRTAVESGIFKSKGSPAESKNYRGISLAKLLAKLFDFILLIGLSNNRLLSQFAYCI